MFVRTKKRDDKTYLMIVESKRVGARIEQITLASLGRLDKLLQSGQLDALMTSLGRFSEKLAVLGAHERGETLTAITRRIGPALVFERLWRELGVGGVIRELAEGRKFGFDLERAIFLTALHRLFDPGSDRAAEKWKDAHAIDGAEPLALQHLYRAMAWLGQPLPLAQQRALSHGMPRCNKDRIEEELFARRRDLLTTLDMVFFDTTSIYFEGRGGQEIGRRGKSKDHRPDLPQMVVGLVLDEEGWPLCCELWPGNTADVKTLLPVAARLQARFGVRRICIVSDRGMISAPTIAALEAGVLDCDYILGARMRSNKEVREVVLADRSAYLEIHPERQRAKDPSPLQVKEVWVQKRRYVVCLNEEQRRKDAADRQAIVAHLRQQLPQGDKALVGNEGYRKYLQTDRGRHFTIDEAKVKEEAGYDGQWVLRTNRTEPPELIAAAYKQLWMVEESFRTMKSILETRPIYHKLDETIRGHVFCSFLALLLKRGLEQRLEQKGASWEWSEILRGLDNLQEVEAVFQGKRFVLRSQVIGEAHKACLAAGVALPPTLREKG